MDKYVHELPLFMMPESDARLTYKDGLVLYDNLTFNSAHAQARVNNEISLPSKLKFNLLLFCCQGEINFTASMKEFNVQSGDAFLLISDSIISSFQMSPDCRLVVVCVSNQMGKKLVDENTVKLFLQRVFTGPFVVHLDETYSSGFIEQYQQMRRCLALPDFSLIQQALRGSFLVLSAIVCNQLSEPDVHSLPRPEAIFRRFMEEVRIHYREHRDIAYYADQLCLTPKHLGRTIHDYSGRRATEIIREYVILQAKTMLRSHQYTVVQIADALNFPSTSFFCRYFKSATGLTPLQY